MMNWISIDKIILNALEEDLGYGDVTTENTVMDNEISEAYFIAKEDGVIAGMEVAKRVFYHLDKEVTFSEELVDGTPVKKGDIMLRLKGRSKSLLLGERTSLNFLQRMSGIATLTNRFVKALEGTETIIVDTRKTAPGLRILDKYSVKVGGGKNHRINLSDAVMIKDNHIDASGGITNAVKRVRKNIGHTLKIEVEVKNMDEVKEAIDNKVDIIMLDNMSVQQCEEAIKFIASRAIVEASGNIDDVNKVKALATAGVNVISSGALTHSVKAMDISMRISAQK